MDEIISFSTMHYFFILSLFINFPKKFECFSIELLHPLSPESPFYKPNITYSKLIEMFSSKPRTRIISPKSISFNGTVRNMKVIRPVLEDAIGGYLVKINLGTFSREQPSYKTYYLNFDTASDINWLQCEDCAAAGGLCFRQAGSPYPNKMSTTYAPLLCGNHKLCFKHQCIKSHCSYNRQYVDGSSSSGILAYETFTFVSSYTHRPETRRIVIGCGIRNKMSTLDENLNEVGILGMGWNPHSFVNQMTPVSHGRFSYCLPPLLSEERKRHSTVLRFGRDTPALHGLRSLPIHQYWGDDFYYVNLEGISINNMRLNITPNYFVKTHPKYGGCIFDTGSTYSFIPQQAFRILKDEMMEYLARVDSSLKLKGRKRHDRLCYGRDPPFKGYANLPTVTFHFEGGVDLVQQRDIAFVVWNKTDAEHVCMATAPASEDNLAIIGAQTQANHVFVYDLPSRMMYFGPRDCAHNP